MFVFVLDFPINGSMLFVDTLLWILWIDALIIDIGIVINVLYVVFTTLDNDTISVKTNDICTDN